MFAKAYHIAVAVLAVTMVLLVVLGGLFTVVQGLVDHFIGVDLWGPVEALLWRLPDVVADAGAAAWAFCDRQLQALWDLARESGLPGFAADDEGARN